MEGHAKSPDFNTIENIWGPVARNMYSGKQQFSSAKALKKSQDGWAKILGFGVTFFFMQFLLQ